MRSPWIIQVALNPVISVLIRDKRDTSAEDKSRKDSRAWRSGQKPRDAWSPQQLGETRVRPRHLDFGPLAPDLGEGKPAVVGPQVRPPGAAAAAHSCEG